MKNIKYKVNNAIQYLQQGKMIILSDDKNRENEGDIVFSAQHATAENINFCIQNAGGIICVSLAKKYCDKFNLDLQTKRNSNKLSAKFTLSIDAVDNITTGVSAFDRAETIRVLLDEQSNIDNITTPGHIFPLEAQPGGVFSRRGHTEGSVDLMELAELKPAAVICEIINKNGSMARGDDLVKLSEQYDLPIISIQDIVNCKIQTQLTAILISETIIPTNKYGKLKASVFKNNIDHSESVVLKPLDFIQQKTTLVRVHSSCFTGDILDSLRCDCGDQLSLSLQKISQENGVLIYLPQEGRGIGLSNKLAAYALQDQGLDTVEANIALGFNQDEREYNFAAAILNYFKITKINLLTNNPDKITQLSLFNIIVNKSVRLIPLVNKENYAYLKTKKDKLGHKLSSF